MKAARVYAERLGWRLLPLHDVTRGPCSCGGDHLKARGSSDGGNGKHPRIAEWQKQATSDLDQLAEWAEQFPRANIGVATGAASRFFVLDEDPDNGGDETLEALVAVHGPLPLTATQQTGSGGHHYLFQMPDFEITNSKRGLVGNGLDIRGTGGQIVVAPSRSGKGSYRWVHAPWDVPIAEAPEWLLERLRPRKAAPGVIAPATAPAARGSFPAASEEVLDAAREALEKFGPAIEGEGGDAHTFTACALLVHDFALTEAEAWPLLLEWNASCEPAWDEDDLLAKLRGGGKYGKAAYGCKRTLDALARVKKEISDWQALVPRDEEQMFAMVIRCRSVVFDDVARRATAERLLVDATGLAVKSIALPAFKRSLPDVPRGSILITTKLHEAADASTQAIKHLLFQRNGILCEVVPTNYALAIHDLEAARVQDLMSQAADFVRSDDKEGLVAQAAPAPIANILVARRTHANVRVIEAVTSAPIFLADGTILQEQGYNAQARVFLEPAEGLVVDVPEEPTREQARAAVRMFSNLLCDFRFITPADFSSWLAGLLSPLVKAATRNAPSPLVCVSAASPGAGKTLLTTVVAQIVTGAFAEIRPYNPRDPAEWGKKLTAFVKAAAPVSVFDNVNGAFGDEALDRLITASTWSDRQLGASEAPPLPNVCTWFATGCNIEPVGDTVRRVLMCRFDTPERPQERTGFRYDLEGGYALEHRGELLSAALTILRAYHVAGRPVRPLPSWGSFTAWSGLVRQALVWTGLPDPFLTQQRASSELNETDNDAHDFWLAAVAGSLDGTAQSVAACANDNGARDVIGARDDVTPWTLKKFISRFVDRPRGGKRIRRNGGIYTVEAV